MIVGISSDHTKVAVVEQYKYNIWIWDLPSAYVEHTLVGHQSCARDVVFSLDNSKVASVSREGAFMEWDTATGQLRHSFTCAALQDTESHMACSPEGTVVIFPIADGSIGILDAATSRERHIMTGSPSPIWRLQISPDGSWLAFALDDTIRVWEVATAQEKYNLRTDFHRSTYCLDFSLDGSRLASTYDSDIIHIWDLNTGSLDHTIYHESTSRSIAFSPDGTQIVSNHHKTLKVWQLTTHEEISQAFKHCWPTIKTLPFLPSQFNLMAWTGTSKRIKRCSVQGVLRICEDQVQGHDDFYSVDSSTEWVTHNGSKILHLPLDMRPRAVNARGNHLVLLSLQGELATLKFKSRRNTALS
ncbi:WD domain-containing protein [Penicillium macrosclerotiorum]|uniref:WD domain-containing protein n=1 Tax=Penicillium macrosclerotiorum TaxID=303699 RepID=UPI0025497146|nr:WD domain-containing protein [Penicillium macrosclerotiorum]KAJ5676186.1 WD domain-containing protein [Penicillium macrosclerotiorum]